MKTKNILTTFLIFCLLSFGLIAIKGYAARTDNFIPIEKSYEPFSCPNSINVYLNQDNDTDGLPDQFFYLNSNFILQGDTLPYSAGQILREDTNGNIKSKVRYYSPLSGMVYKIASGGFIGPLDNYTFWRASWVFPYNTPIRGIATTTNKVVFERPSDNNSGKNTVGFYYDYVYKYAVGWDGNSSSSYWYNQIPNMAYLGNTYVTYVTTLPGSYGNRKRARSSERTYSVCRDYQLHRCGDGIIDTYSDSSRANAFSGEVCDDGPNNGQAGYCNATCSGTGGGFFCGDEIINNGSSETVILSGNGLYYGPMYYSGNELIFETCDDGNDPNDPDGLFNQDGTGMFCSSNCFENFTEAFVEVFINE